MTRERKELAVGDSPEQAVEVFNDTYPNGYADPDELARVGRHELVQDPITLLWSIYNKRRPTDRTIKRPITRVARAPYSNGYGRDRRPVVITLLPRELIETRLHGTRRRYTISWDDLHAYLVRRHALAVMRTKQQLRAERRKKRQQERRKR